MASMNGHYEIVKLLLDSGANINPEASQEASPLRCALNHKHDKVAELLRERGAIEWPQFHSQFQAQNPVYNSDKFQGDAPGN